MITIKYKDEDYELKNELQELTIGEFEHVCTIHAKETTLNEKIIEILIHMGIPENVIEEMDINDFNAIVKELNYDSTNTTLLNKFEHNGIEYVNNEDKFKLSVRQNMLIEEYIIKNNIHYMAEVLAVLYNDKDNTSIAVKTNIFRNEVSAEIIIPIIYYISKLKQND